MLPGTIPLRRQLQSLEISWKENYLVVRVSPITHRRISHIDTVRPIESLLARAYRIQKPIRDGDSEKIVL
jgi:hypothetical protein